MEIEDVLSMLRRLNSEHRLECVVRGQLDNAGKRAPLCPEIIRDSGLMCAGCAAKSMLMDARS